MNPLCTQQGLQGEQRLNTDKATLYKFHYYYYYYYSLPLQKDNPSSCSEERVYGCCISLPKARSVLKYWCKRGSYLAQSDNIPNLYLPTLCLIFQMAPPDGELNMTVFTYRCKGESV